MKTTEALKILYGLQSYGLEEAFDNFVRKVSSTLDQVKGEPFEWVDNEGDEVTIYVTIQNVPVLIDEDGEVAEYEMVISFESDLERKITRI